MYLVHFRVSARRKGSLFNLALSGGRAAGAINLEAKQHRHRVSYLVLSLPRLQEHPPKAQLFHQKSELLGDASCILVKYDVDDVHLPCLYTRLPFGLVVSLRKCIAAWPTEIGSEPAKHIARYQLIDDKGEYLMTKLNENFANELLAVVYTAMSDLVRRDAQTPEAWKNRADRIKIHGLLNFKTPSRHKPKEIVMDAERLDDPRYRRSMVRKLQAPRPGKWNYHNIEVDRNRLLTDETYFADMVKVMSYRWLEALLPISDATDAVILLKLDMASLEFCMDKLGPHQVSSWLVAGVMLRNMAEELVDNNPRYLAAVASIRETAAEARKTLVEAMAVIREDVLSTHRAETDAILAKVNKDADDFLAGMNARIAETAANSKRALDESRERDAELARADEERGNTLFRRIRRRFGR